MTVLKPLIYFSLFDHPLTEEEAFLYSETPNKEIVKKDLDTLVGKGVVERVDDFLLFKKNEAHISKRIQGNKQAEIAMPKATRTAEFISKFPFVKGVAISGSLSKGYFDGESDFDFFIITKAKRVWITRTMLALYKRIFLLNSHKEFCINYFVSTATLEIEEKNRFTATEIATVIPLFGKEVFHDFYSKNSWVSSFFPNVDLERQTLQTDLIKKPPYAMVIQFFLDNFIGQAINYFSMKVVTKRWAFKYRKKTNNPYKSKKEISKNHPENFQDRVIRKLNSEYESCSQKHGIHIPKEYA